MGWTVNDLQPKMYPYCGAVEDLPKAVSRYNMGSVIGCLQESGGLPSYRDLHALYWIGEMTAKDRLFDDTAPDIVPADKSDLWNFTQHFFGGLVDNATWVDLGVQTDGDKVTFSKGLCLPGGELEAKETLETSLKDIGCKERNLAWPSFGKREGAKRDLTRFVFGIGSEQQEYIFAIVHGNVGNPQYRKWPRVGIPNDEDGMQVYQLTHRHGLGQVMLPRDPDYQDRFTGAFGVENRKLLAKIATEVRDRYVKRAGEEIGKLGKVKF